MAADASFRRGWLISVGLTGCVLLAGVRSPVASTAEPASSDFAPVSPTPAVHAALQANLKLVRDWLGDKDYLSAAQAADGLLALAQLHAYQGSQPAWREKSAALQEACARLLTAARAKDAAGCEKQAQECERLLADLARTPSGNKVVEKNFKTFGASKTWMLLMDGAYADAKTTKNLKELEDLAWTIAEEMNVVERLRSEDRWRQNAREVREAAIAVATHAPSSNLETARKELRQVYARCEVCHQGYKR